MHGTDNPVEPFYDSLAQENVKQLHRTAKKYSASYLLTSREPLLPLPRVYENGSYAVYALVTVP